MHWTQTPEGRKKNAENLARGRMVRAKQLGIQTPTGNHWTQTPDGRAKLSKISKKAWASGKRGTAHTNGSGRPTEISKLVTGLAHSLVDRQLNGGLTKIEREVLAKFADVIENYI